MDLGVEQAIRRNSSAPTAESLHAECDEWLDTAKSGLKTRQMARGVRIASMLLDLEPSDSSRSMATSVYRTLLRNMPESVQQVFQRGGSASEMDLEVPASQRSMFSLVLTSFGEYLMNTEHDLNQAAAALRTSLLLDPDDCAALGSLAMLLHRSKAPPEEVQAAYEDYARRASASGERGCMHATVLVKYGNWCKARGDRAAAEQWYRLALDRGDPTHPEALGSLAVLLHSAGTPRADEAERCYRAAIESHPFHTNNLGNFGLFCADVREDPDLAEELYQRALEVDPAHANTLYNYAVLKDSVRGDAEGAIALYRRAIDAQPLHAFALYNLAVLLEDSANQFDDAETHYRLAIEADPGDASVRGDYGAFLWKRRHDREGAVRVFEDALRVDAEDETLLRRYMEFLLDPEAVATEERPAALRRAAEFRRKLHAMGATDLDV